MATVFDVAAYILEKQGEMTTMKLQKLCYYSQAWHLTWTGESLFPNQIEAWVNGPVIRDLYMAHKGQFMIDHLERGNSSDVTEDQKASIDAVLEAYGTMKPYELIDQTHSESPWKDARKGLSPTEHSTNQITNDAMYTFYSYPDESE